MLELLRLRRHPFAVVAVATDVNAVNFAVRVFLFGKKTEVGAKAARARHVGRSARRGIVSRRERHGRPRIGLLGDVAAGAGRQRRPVRGNLRTIANQVGDILCQLVEWLDKFMAEGSHATTKIAVGQERAPYHLTQGLPETARKPLYIKTSQKAYAHKQDKDVEFGSSHKITLSLAL